METTTYIALPDLLTQLENQPMVIVRLATGLDDNPSAVHTLLVETVPEEQIQTFVPFYRDYGATRFLGTVCPGGIAGNWLRGGAIKVGHVHGNIVTSETDLQASDVTSMTFQVSPLTDGTYGSHFPSHTLDGHVTLPWPYTSYSLNYRNSHTSEPSSRLLIAPDNPFYPSFRTALLSLVFQDANWHAVTAANSIHGPQVILRFADLRGWFRQIRLSPTAIHVHITGNELANSYLSVNGPNAEHTQPILEAGDYEIPLPGSIPDSLWIVLARGREWLDYYARTGVWNPFQKEPPHVSLDEGLQTTELEALIYQGEGIATEFKAQLEDDNDKWLKTVAAFANGDGGVILIGVENGTGDLKGIGGAADIPGLKDRIINAIRSRVIPEPTVRLVEGTVDYRTILAVFVNQGSQPPYGLDPDPRRTRYYVRRGANSFPARPEEIRASVLANQQRPRGPYDDILYPS